MTRALAHRLIHGHPQKPWVTDLEGHRVGCQTCARQRLMRAIEREPRRVPPVGF